MRRRIAGGNDLAAEGDCALPVTRLAQDGSQTSQTELRGRLQRIGGTEAERLVLGFLGRGVVPGVLERIC